MDSDLGIFSAAYQLASPVVRVASKTVELTHSYGSATVSAGKALYDMGPIRATIRAAQLAYTAYYSQIAKLRSTGEFVAFVGKNISEIDKIQSIHMARDFFSMVKFTYQIYEASAQPGNYTVMHNFESMIFGLSIITDIHNIAQKPEEKPQHDLYLLRDTLSFATAVVGITSSLSPEHLFSEGVSYILSAAQSTPFFGDDSNIEEVYKTLTLASMAASTACGAYSVYRNKKRIQHYTELFVNRTTELVPQTIETTIRKGKHKTGRITHQARHVRMLAIANAENFPHNHLPLSTFVY